MRLSVRRYALSCLLVVVASAAVFAFAQAPPQTVDISDPQAGGTVTVFAGDTVQVRLHSTPGTGYSWKVTQVNNAVLALQAAPVFVPPPPGIAGAEGHTVFNFQAAAPGSSTLLLAYARPTEQKAAPAQTFSLGVTVRPASERPMPQP
jgi:inhibitor of cysteine peptidase